MKKKKEGALVFFRYLSLALLFQSPFRPWILLPINHPLPPSPFSSFFPSSFFFSPVFPSFFFLSFFCSFLFFPLPEFSIPFFLFLTLSSFPFLLLFFFFLLFLPFLPLTRILYPFLTLTFSTHTSVLNPTEVLRNNSCKNCPVIPRLKGLKDSQKK